MKASLLPPPGVIPGVIKVAGRPHNIFVRSKANACVPKKVVPLVLNMLALI